MTAIPVVLSSCTTPAGPQNRGKINLIATDTREVGDATEIYAWVVKVDAISLDPNDPIILSNHNLLDGDDPNHALAPVYKTKTDTIKISDEARNALAALPEEPAILEERPRLAPGVHTCVLH